MRPISFVAVPAALLLSAASPVHAMATCSDAENQDLLDLYSAAAETSACAPYSTFMPIGTAAIYWPCDATDCQEVMVQVASDMPDCWYMGNNQKEALQEAVDRCAGETLDWTTTGSSVDGGDSAAAPGFSSGSSADLTDTPSADDDALTATPDLDSSSSGSMLPSEQESTQPSTGPTVPAVDSTSTSAASTQLGAALWWSAVAVAAHA